MVVDHNWIRASPLTFKRRWLLLNNNPSPSPNLNNLLPILSPLNNRSNKPLPPTCSNLPSNNNSNGNKIPADLEVKLVDYPSSLRVSWRTCAKSWHRTLR